MKEPGVSDKEQINQLNLDVKSLENSMTLIRREIAKSPLDIEFLEGQLNEMTLEKKEKVAQINLKKRS